MMLWFVGKFIELESRFEIQGVFSTRDKAVAACREREYFVTPLLLDENLPDQDYVFTIAAQATQVGLVEYPRVSS